MWGWLSIFGRNNGKAPTNGKIPKHVRDYFPRDRFKDEDLVNLGERMKRAAMIAHWETLGNSAPLPASEESLKELKKEMKERLEEQQQSTLTSETTLGDGRP